MRAGKPGLNEEERQHRHLTNQLGLRLPVSMRWPPTALILLVIASGALLSGCSTNSLPNTRAMVRSILEHDHRNLNQDDYAVPGLPPPGTRQAHDTEADIGARFQRYLKIEAAISKEPLVPGNKVVLLENGPASYRAMFTAIGAARNSINLESFGFVDDVVGRQFAAALIAARARGAQVNVMYDSLGSFDTPSEFFDNMRRHGVSVVEFNPVNPFAGRHLWPWHPWSIWPRDHRKLLIVDGKTAFTGGINITADYERGISRRPRGENVRDMWRDTDVEIQGPAVTKLQSLFVSHWLQYSGTPLPTADYFPVQGPARNVMVRAIGSSQDAGFSEMYVSLISAVWHSERNAYITTAYFTPDEQLLRALEQAAKRGVDVELLLPKHTDVQITRYAAHDYYQQLLDAGVKIYERKDAILHAKTVTIDGVWSTVGSTNLDWLSFAEDDEINITVLDAGFAGEMERAFAGDREQSAEITRKQWLNRSYRARIRDWLASRLDRWL